MESISRRQERGAFPDYFKQADIVILAEGDAHGAHAPAIVKFIDSFCDRVDGIFVEIPTDLQNSIDEYMRTGIVARNLELLFTGAANEGKEVREATLAVFDKARAKGLKVICFDASKTRTENARNPAKIGRYYLAGECRDEDMYSSVITYYDKHPGKYIIIVGDQHLRDQNIEGDFINFGPRMKIELGNKCTTLRMTQGLYLDADAA